MTSRGEQLRKTKIFKGLPKKCQMFDTFRLGADVKRHQIEPFFHFSNKTNLDLDRTLQILKESKEFPKEISTFL